MTPHLYYKGAWAAGNRPDDWRPKTFCKSASHPRRPLIIMKINENVKLVLKDVYLYDIEACHYTIMEKLGMDISSLDRNDKAQRNIEIGKMMRKNPKLTSLLRNTTKSIIDEYIMKNNVTEDDILIRQYDGILTTKVLRTTNIKHIPFEMRKRYLTFIISIDRTKYIGEQALEGGMTVKGVSFRYPQMDMIYKKVCSINFTKKSQIFIQLQRIKDDFLKSNNPYLFGVPTKKGFNIFLKGYGELEVTESTIKLMDTDDIDKERYFKFYIEPFTKTS